MKEYTKSLFSGLFIGIGISVALELGEVLGTLFSLKEIKPDMANLKEMAREYRNATCVHVEKEVKF